ncbi:MAG: LysM peptidoglycan-binding domain-containing protein [Candidatus Cloacimonadales bacterium]|jgi:nucleoid-associated protein YgaU|nr:LysM peptidoglycan-binding domain-containing protein [Candidatus Cloacimonadota bacterium]MDD2650303.1 LysM peptidoglycan-binding domain-containing protein [Candidatus Cloacimonadota bacterium]MDD3501306.1 LysM peptidoglycan-binding domain-containing protein [Candidatus Cloacimonadota bacterium]MDX9976450.1 LysM peptidoglycan-binding domain-containing protein [Candidatus Cloacimonadales bacterium]
MKKIILISMLFVLMLPLTLNAAINYLNDDEYKQLNKTEREQYWTSLENELETLNLRRSNAEANIERDTAAIARLNQRLSEINSEIQRLYDTLGITEENLNAFRASINYYKNQVANWENMSDSELWENAKAFKELDVAYNETKEIKLARLPEFKREFTDLDRRFAAIYSSMDDIERARIESRQYYEDNYSVVKGDYLSKIAAYDHIYGDSKKWGIIYRANRDQIKDPNILSVGMNLAIPRGLPTSWKVYRGESLWRIASYPEVYEQGSKWPLIYRANKDQIKDPNLIYPNQIFSIPRD